ncbi:XTP/dITP diphosphatase [Clostridium sp. 'White wine YQ']|uniref:XTP/dITP diphosphatase n=1 Tax=Clostridium sp. 'White wine YQ' TaxID=3027474 RepID=UPI0023663242|nr:XTP/dITP diphosphatase [Clostridium sp. 'White wine YQ']MDD7795740.1 XTP/dITP diphosphatase [Clostridium sp. 'White wine YQ']
MKKLVLATNNKNKVKEIKEILSAFNLNIVTLKDLNIDVDVEENGTSFDENALIKASAIADILISKGYDDFIVLSDDSGLEVDYLDGEPGIFSARYAGNHGDDEANNIKLLDKLKNVPKEKRKAKFRCSIAIINNLGENKVVQGEVQGIILNEPLGSSGFGYDPLFYYEPFNKTFAQLSPEEKNKVSHRAKALIKLKEEMTSFV